MASNQPLGSHEMTERQKTVFDDLKWGQEEVFARRPDLVNKHSENGGVVAVCRRRIVADAPDLDELELEVTNQGCRLSEVAIVEIPSVHFP